MGRVGIIRANTWITGLPALMRARHGEASRCPRGVASAYFPISPFRHDLSPDFLIHLELLTDSTSGASLRHGAPGFGRLERIRQETTAAIARFGGSRAEVFFLFALEALTNGQ